MNYKISYRENLCPQTLEEHELLMFISLQDITGWLLVEGLLTLYCPNSRVVKNTMASNSFIEDIFVLRVFTSINCDEN